MFATKLIIASF